MSKYLAPFIGFILLVSLSGMANATLPNDKWHAEGVRMTKFQFLNNSISVTPISVSGFDSELLCKAFVDAQKAMPLGTFEGAAIFSSVVAKCSQSQ